MRPSPTKNETTDFGPPVDWRKDRDGTCGRLSVRTEHVGIRPYHYSTWVPSLDELKMLNDGGVIELTCVGVQPPVALAVIKRAECHDKPQ